MLGLAELEYQVQAAARNTQPGHNRPARITPESADLRAAATCLPSQPAVQSRQGWQAGQLIRSAVSREPVALRDWPRRPPRGRRQDPGSRSRRTPGEDRRKIEQPGRTRCSRSLAEASSCSSAAGSSYSEVANSSLVQDFWREVRAVRPGDRPDLRVDSHLCEDLGIAQRHEHSCPALNMGQVHVTCQAVRERQPEPVVAQHLDVRHVMQERSHRSMLRQRGNRQRRLMRLHERPVSNKAVGGYRRRGAEGQVPWNDSGCVLCQAS